MATNFTGFINDGYNRTAYIAEVPGIYDALKITYRPCTSEERSAHGDEVSGGGLVHGNKKASALLGKHIQSWSIPNVKPDANAMLKLNLNLFNRIYQIVLGNDGGDEEPNAEPSDITPSAVTESNNAGN